MLRWIFHKQEDGRGGWGFTEQWNNSACSACVCANWHGLSLPRHQLIRTCYSSSSSAKVWELQSFKSLPNGFTKPPGNDFLAQSDRLISLVFTLLVCLFVLFSGYFLDNLGFKKCWVNVIKKKQTHVEWFKRPRLWSGIISFIQKQILMLCRMFVSIRQLFHGSHSDKKLSFKHKYNS